MAIVKDKTSRGDSRFKVRVRGFPQETFQTRAEARVREQQFKTLKRESYLKQRFLKHESRPGGFQIVPAFDVYWNQWSAQRRGKVSPGWRQTQDKMYQMYIESLLGPLALEDIRPIHIGALLSEAQERGRLKPQSVLHIYQLLHKMFDDAIEYYEYLDTNPVIKRLRPELKQVERPFLTPVQSWVLLDHVRSHWIGPATWLMTLSGLRIGETQALRWSSVNFSEGYISIRASFDHKMQRINDYPKQGDWGRAPMPAALKEFLQPLSEAKSPDDLVCPGRDGGFHWRGRFGTALSKICKELRLQRVTAHELRHSCTELYIEAGASAEDIRRLLNQSSLTATARYIHRTDERLQRISSQVLPKLK